MKKYGESGQTEKLQAHLQDMQRGKRLFEPKTGDFLGDRNKPTDSDSLMRTPMSKVEADPAQYRMQLTDLEQRLVKEQKIGLTPGIRAYEEQELPLYYAPGGHVDPYEQSLIGNRRGAVPRDLLNRTAGNHTAAMVEKIKARLYGYDEWNLQKPSGSSLHHFLEYTKAHRNVDTEMADVMRDQFQVFVIEHDWAKAFKGATDFHTGEFPFPYDYCCFELRVNGVRVLILIGPDRNGALAFGIDDEWLAMSVSFSPDGVISMTGDAKQNANESFVGFIAAQLRGVCIMLDAEVAELEVRRAPEKLNRAREKHGKTLLKDYHVVRLAHRHRVRAAEERASDFDENYTRKRLHFRRGHDRHYQNYKVWIRWQLVGDPELGFVDKEYRL